MNSNWIQPAIGLTSLLLLTGCATVPREAGFPEVQQLVAERGIDRVHWNQGTPEDVAVSNAIEQLLKADLTADEVVQIALLNNCKLQATYADLMVAQADVVQAGLLKNPVFEGQFKIHEADGDLAFEGSIVQDFVDIFQIPLRKRIAEGQFESAKLRVADQILSVALETRSSFYRLQADQQSLELRKTVLEASDASYAVAKELRRVGNITELSLLQERAQFEQAKLDYAAAEAMVLVDREELSALMGVWGSAGKWRTAPRLPEPSSQTQLAIDTLEQDAVRNSLALAGYRQQYQTAGGRLQLIRPFAWLPEGEAGVAAEHNSADGWAIGPAIALPIPLFDQGQARTATALAELNRTRDLYAATAIDIRAEARAAALRLRAAQERVAYYRQVILPVRQQVLDQTQLQYNAMQVGVFQLLQARQDQVRAGAEYIEALRSYWLARARAEAIAAGHLPTGRASSDIPQVSAAQGSGDGDH